VDAGAVQFLEGHAALAPHLPGQRVVAVAALAFVGDEVAAAAHEIAALRAQDQVLVRRDGVSNQRIERP
jgi:hypothetical protein